MIYLEDRHRDIINKILKKYHYTFYAFGSRVRGTHKPFSDLDLCSMEEIPEMALAHIQEDFEESDLPFKVDIIEWSKISQRFQSLIENELVPYDQK